MTTLEELGAMDDVDLRAMLAELVGWKPVFIARDMTGTPFPGQDIPPNYPSDLNACHAVVMGFTPEQRDKHESLIHHHYLSLSMLLAMDARKATCFLIATLQPQ